MNEDPTENLKLLTAILQDLQRQGVEWSPNESTNTIDFMRFGWALGHIYRDDYYNTQLTLGS